MSLFWADTMAKCITPRFYLAETVRQVYSIGVKSLLLTSTVAVSVGIVMSMQTLGTLESFGATNYVAVVVGLAMVKELGPVLTAIMVAGRAGSGISAELGSMRVTRQIDALTVSAVNPMRYLVVTHVMACMVAVPLLTIIADVVGIIGGMVIVVLEGHMGGHLYLSYTVRFVALRDVIPGLLKTVPFGLLIGLVASFYGFHTQGGTEGVGNATKSSVVTSALLIILSDVVFTRLLLGIFGR
jgi:phospholipid/cholesterol/gamma-HCH transport system permease protein